MFAKLSLLALSLPLVSALTFKTPTDVVSGKPTTFTWTLDGTEPSPYYLFITGPSYQYFGSVTDREQTSITVVPDVRAGEYILFAGQTPYGHTFAQSATFSISAAPSRLNLQNPWKV